MCGQEGDLKKTKVEGARLDLCEDCREVGEVVESSATSTPATSDRPTRTTPPGPTAHRELVEGFDRKVKRAREARDLGVQELAQMMKEKTSVVRRVESGRLKPDRDLARKFERQLDVELYSAPPEEPSVSSESDEEEQTLGDVADVKRGD